MTVMGLLMFMILSLVLFLISPSFLMSWVMMECSTLSFLSLSCFNLKNQKYSFVTSYYLIQVVGSALLMFSFSLMMGADQGISQVSILFYNFALLMKIGLFPFHIWVLNLVPLAGWLTILLLGTAQKFMPMLLLSFYMLNWYIMFVSIITMMIVIYGLIGLVSVKMIFGYSMLSHSSWMILMLWDIGWWFGYMIVYFSLFLLICVFHHLMYIDDFNSLNNFKFVSWIPLFFFFVNLLSFMGMPPLSGFLIKWIILDSLSGYISYYMMLLVVITSLISFYMYMRVLIFNMMIMSGQSLSLSMFIWGLKVSMNLYSVSSFLIIFVLSMYLIEF